MTPEDYSQEVIRTCAGDLTNLKDILTMGAIGLGGEAGEVCEAVKKYVFHNHGFDTDAFAKELGDALWYLTLLAYSTGYSLQEIMDINVTKLRKRYPHGFDPERSISRTNEEE